jgi:hypothetical protein
MIGLTIALLAVLTFWAFAEWRLGLVLCLATAILQDPLRKLTPDKPVIFVVLVGAVFGAAFLGAWAQDVPLTPRSIFGRERRLATTMWLLLTLVILEAFNSLFRFGNPMISLVGLLTYLLPLPSIAFAYQLVVRGGEARIYQFMTAYLVGTTLALTTVYLEYAGYNWPVFGQVGGNLLLFDKYVGGVIVPHSGIFRASEIAAWHAMTCTCLVLLLVTLRKFNFLTLLTAAIVVALLIGAAILTGRRKAIVEVAVFASTYCILWFVLHKGAAKLGIALAVAGLVGFSWLVIQMGDSPAYVDQETLSYNRYVERSKTVFEDVPSRFTELGIAPIMWAYEGFGLFGAGLGVGTQGTQYFGGGGAIGAGAAEGGLGKIALELGIPGLFLIAWFAILVFNYLWRIMRDASQVSPRTARLSYGLFSFLVANVAAFSVATQAYGDIFILLILSWTLGFLLAVPVLLERELRARQPAIFEQPARVLGPKTV